MYRAAFNSMALESATRPEEFESGLAKAEGGLARPRQANRDEICCLIRELFPMKKLA